MTIQTLRDELQALLAGKADAVQAAVAAGRAESLQLQQAIAALRAELEARMFRHAGELEEQARVAGDELRQLRGTISSLRTLMENQNGR